MREPDAMPIVSRVLPDLPVASLDAYVDAGGGQGLTAARKLDPASVIEEISASGLRGRGGAGFPAGRKWSTVLANRSAVEPSTVVVNAAEGEPGCFKDRMILRYDPYRVLEGALIAGHAVGADTVIVGIKRVFEPEIARLHRVVQEVQDAGWAPGITIDVVEGPSEYLFGEETALLEVIDGRYPFPRIAPPFRRGVEEFVETTADVDDGSTSPAHVEMAGSSGETTAPPTLASNVETFANVADIVTRGSAWFRELGTAESPGTIVCTVSGATRRAGVGEFAMGTPLREVIDVVSGGARPGRRIVGVMSGVANAVVPESMLDTPVTYEAFASIGSGLGAAGFVVFDDATDMVAVAAGVSRFLAVESCGQCTPCKQDGLIISDSLERLREGEAHQRDLDEIDARLVNVAFGARCNLATQHQVVVESIMRLFPEQFTAHLRGTTPATPPYPIAALVQILRNQAIIDHHEALKQPDWSFDEDYSGKAPADRLDDHRAAAEQI
jgi:NADH:ubiquinone oxidoreductase subunit F (NADH-binding)